VRPPQVTEFFHRLRGRGLVLDSLPVTLPEAVATYEAVRPRLCFRPRPFAAVPPPPQAARLTARDLTYVYADGTKALAGVTLDIRAGEYVAVVGQNGAGKTTLVRNFLGLLKPSAGVLALDGRRLQTLPVGEISRHIGLVPQNPDTQLFAFSVAAEVGFALEQAGLPPGEVGRRVDEVLAAMDLTARRDLHPFVLSKGDRSRVVIAAVLAREPGVLIFDEPTTGQDHRGALRILELTRRLHAAGKTVLVVTHEPDIANHMKRIIRFKDGRVVADERIENPIDAEETLKTMPSIEDDEEVAA
jgi:energy-coupling factor transport system ATP-binding protein